jgi:capsid protein
MKTPTGTRKNLVLGVLLSDLSKPLEYWVTKDDVGALSTIKLVGDMQRIPARDADGFRNAFHPRMRRRLSQTRGVTPLAPATDMIGIHDDLQFATLVKAQIAACFAIIREMNSDGKSKPTTPPRGAAGDTQLGLRENEMRVDGTSDKTEQIGPGMDIRGREGEKITGFAPGIPNPEFFPHATMVLTFISINLGLPLAVLLLDPSKTNFSGWRGAVDQARQGFRRLQKSFSDQWFTPIYHWKLRQFAADDRKFARFMEELGTNAFKHEWQSPGWDYIQPVQDAQADHYQVSHLLTSPRRAAGKRNLVKAQIDKETAEDNAQSLAVFMDAAAKFNDERKLTGTDKEVPWQYFMRLPLPDQVSMTTDPAAEDGSTSKQSQETAA